MRREYVETTPPQAAPSPARPLLTSSAPSPTVTAPATPTSRPFNSLRGLPRLAGRAGGQPIVKRALRPPKGESSSPASDRPDARSPHVLVGAHTASEALWRVLSRCDYYSLTMLHYILWRSTDEVKYRSTGAASCEESPRGPARARREARRTDTLADTPEIRSTLP